MVEYEEKLGTFTGYVRSGQEYYFGEPGEWDDDYIFLPDGSRNHLIGAVPYNPDEWDAARKKLEENHHVFPLFKYEHSGVAYSTTPFSCQWDSGQIGWMVVSNEWSNPEEAAGIKARELTAWAMNEGYDWYIENQDGERLEGCGGYLHQEDAEEEMLLTLRALHEQMWEDLATFWYGDLQAHKIVGQVAAEEACHGTSVPAL